jgi:hypothetical protein
MLEIQMSTYDSIRQGEKTLTPRKLFTNMKEPTSATPEGKSLR